MTPCRIVRGLILAAFGVAVSVATKKALEKEFDQKLNEAVEEVRGVYAPSDTTPVDIVADQPDRAADQVANPHRVDRPKMSVFVEEPYKGDSDMTLQKAMSDYASKQATVGKAEFKYNVGKVAHVITKAEYYSDDPDYQNLEKVNLVYYEGDDVVAHWDDEVVTDRLNVVGKEFVSCFVPDGPTRTTWVRNIVLGVDYEIDLNEGRYADIVAGVGPDTLPKDDDDDDPLRPGRRA